MALTLRLTKGKALTYQELDNNFTSIIAGTATIVANLAALRALSKLTTSEAIVQGSTTVGDGGGGTYSYNAADVTSTDNGNTLIVGADGGRWYLTPFPTTGTIASAATTDIGTILGAIVTVSGTVTITALGDTMPVGTSKMLQILSSGLSITPSANLILSTGLSALGARGYLSFANDRIKVDCIGTNAGHNVYFCQVIPFDGTAYQTRGLGWEKQNFLFAPGANTIGGLTAHPLTAIDIQNCNSITLTTNGDANQIGANPVRSIRLENLCSQGNTVGNNNNTHSTGWVHSDINVNVSCTVSSGVITAGGLDTGSNTINTDYFLYAVSDGVNGAYVWSKSVQFPNTAAFPNYIYAALCGWQHSNAGFQFRPWRKFDNKYTIVGDGNSYPVIASGSNGGVNTAVTLYAGGGAPGYVSPQAGRVDLRLHSSTSGASVSVTANNVNPVGYGITQPAANASTIDMYVGLDIESAFIFYKSNDAAADLRLFGFQDVI